MNKTMKIITNSIIIMILMQVSSPSQWPMLGYRCDVRVDRNITSNCGDPDVLCPGTCWYYDVIQENSPGWCVQATFLSLCIMMPVIQIDEYRYLRSCIRGGGGTFAYCDCSGTNLYPPVHIIFDSNCYQ